MDGFGYENLIEKSGFELEKIENYQENALEKHNKDTKVIDSHANQKKLSNQVFSEVSFFCLINS